MKKVKFSTKYKDINDGEKIKVSAEVAISEPTDDLGHKFVFIDATHFESGRNIHQEISLPKKAVKKLIKALQKVTK